MKLWVGLVHHPVRDREGAVITTAITNLDVHDVARSARTYELDGFFLITPIEAQRRLVQRILSHWRDGVGATRVPERSEALARCEVIDTVQAAVAEVARRAAEAPLVVATGARADGPVVSYAALSEELSGRAGLLLFGTGHGLAPSVVRSADRVLAPIEPGSSYNHLSVRAAVAITLDRLLGRV